MEYTHTEIELIDTCLEAMKGRRASLNLTSKFSGSPDGTQDRIQAFMVSEGLIKLTDGNTVGKYNAVITDKGNTLLARYENGSFRKYLEQAQAGENEIKRKDTEAKEVVERATRASEKSAKYEGLNIYIGLALLVVSIFAAWQTSKANDKDRVIEIQKQHIQQLESQLHSIQ